MWHNLGNQHTIAKILRARQSQISRILRANGLGVGRGKRKPVHQLPMDLIAIEYSSGLSTNEIGRKYGVDGETIRRRLVRLGHPMRKRGEYEKRGERNHQWKGGKSFEQDRQYNKLARRVAEFCLGKKLSRQMVVHHHDENRKNNSFDNLWVFPSFSDHSRYHQQLLKIQFPIASMEANRLALENGGLRLPEPSDRSLSLHDINLRHPYDMTVLLENRLKECGILRGKTVRLRERHQ